CFFGKLTEMPPKNSAIRTHYRNRSGGVDAKVYSNNSPIIYTCVSKFDFFLKREIQKPLFAAFLECRGTLPAVPAVSVDIIHIGLPETYGDPVPRITDINFDLSRIIAKLVIHSCPVHGRKYIPRFWTGWLLSDRIFDPVAEVALIRRYLT